MLKGWVRTSLIDYPGQIAAVLFLGGCNLRCPMCHNGELIEAPHQLPDIPLEEVYTYLLQRKGRITGVVVSGGEPCLQPDLPTMLTQLRTMGLKTKLDTNGTRPDMLVNLLDGVLLDAVAMDIKAPPAGYDRLSGTTVDRQTIEQSISLLRASNLWIEFRTTVVPGLLTKADIHTIGEWLSGAPRYVLQQFSPQHCYEEGLRHTAPYPTAVLKEMALDVSPFFDEVLLRGV